MPDITLAELATLTRRHIVTIRRLAREGKLPGVYRVGSRWMIRRDAVDRLRGLPAPAENAG
jgi:excisionase family DNA binding protein